tara:strand:- start:2055 stop:2318 length:264 start_codon:yes stop_codon:yes gene_type:complete
MASAVDTTFPADNVKVSKATMRSQFLTIYNEITALQQRTGTAGAKAFYGFMDESEVREAIRRVTTVDFRRDNVAADTAFGRTSLTSL